MPPVRKNQINEDAVNETTFLEKYASARFKRTLKETPSTSEFHSLYPIYERRRRGNFNEQKKGD